jgi:transcriptional regulator with XRE-family HTH domain
VRTRTYHRTRLFRRLALLRRQRGIPQRQLADALHISVAGVSRLENGLFVPTDEELQVIAKVLGVEPSPRLLDFVDAGVDDPAQMMVAR